MYAPPLPFLASASESGASSPGANGSIYHTAPNSVRSSRSHTRYSARTSSPLKQMQSARECESDWDLGLAAAGLPLLQPAPYKPIVDLPEVLQSSVVESEADINVDHNTRVNTNTHTHTPHVNTPDVNTRPEMAPPDPHYPPGTSQFWISSAASTAEKFARLHINGSHLGFVRSPFFAQTAVEYAKHCAAVAEDQLREQHAMIERKEEEIRIRFVEGYSAADLKVRGLAMGPSVSGEGEGGGEAKFDFDFGADKAVSSWLGTKSGRRGAYSSSAYSKVLGERTNIWAGDEEGRCAEGKRPVGQKDVRAYWPDVTELKAEGELRFRMTGQRRLPLPRVDQYSEAMVLKLIPRNIGLTDEQIDTLAEALVLSHQKNDIPWFEREIADFRHKLDRLPSVAEIFREHLMTDTGADPYAVDAAQAAAAWATEVASASGAFVPGVVNDLGGWEGRSRSNSGIYSEPTTDVDSDVGGHSSTFGPMFDGFGGPGYYSVSEGDPIRPPARNMRGSSTQRQSVGDYENPGYHSVSESGATHPLPGWGFSASGSGPVLSDGVPRLQHGPGPGQFLTPDAVPQHFGGVTGLQAQPVGVTGNGDRPGYLRPDGPQVKIAPGQGHAYYPGDDVKPPPGGWVFDEDALQGQGVSFWPALLAAFGYEARKRAG